MGSSSRGDAFRRLVAILLYSLAIVGSLVVFPNAIWLVAAIWLAIASLQFARSKPCWAPVAVCTVILVVKQLHWSPALIAFSLSLLVAVVVLFRQRKVIEPGDASRRIGWTTIAVVWLLWLVWNWESYTGRHARRLTALIPDRPIVCLGDSLTTGLGEDEAYPDYLRNLVGVPVINWGRPGVTARDMTKHLPEILEDRPQLVVVELGGHDFLRGYGREATRESLVTIIKACQDAGATVVLVEIPRGFITDPFSGLERELAREYDLELIPDSMIRMLVVRSPAIPLVGDIAKPHLSGDGLHPNVVGADYLAKGVYGALCRLYGPAVTSAASKTPPPDSR